MQARPRYHYLILVGGTVRVCWRCHRRRPSLPAAGDCSPTGRGVTDLAVAPTAVSLDDDDDFTHMVCCDPNVALCGADVTTAQVVDASPAEDECIVCVDLDRLPCPRCGT